MNGFSSPRLLKWHPPINNHDENKRGKPISATLSLIRTAADGDAQAVKDLLAEGADVNGTNQGGQTPLMLAALMGQQEIVSLLLDAGADAQLQDRHGLTALEWSTRRGFWEVTDLLKRASALVTPLPPKEIPDSVHAEEEKELQPASASRVKPGALQEGGFGPAAKAALKSLEVRRESEVALSEAAAPPEAQEVLNKSEPSESGSYQSTESNAFAIEAVRSEPSTDREPEPGSLAMNVASAASEPATLLPDSEPPPFPSALDEPPAEPLAGPTIWEAFSHELQTPEPDRVSAALRSPEVVSLTADNETLTRSSARKLVPEITAPEETSSPASTASEPFEPIETRRSRRAFATKNGVPAFQTSTLGLSTLTTSGGSSELANKRCPQCSTVFENTPLEYCTRDTARLIPLDEAGLTSDPSPSSTRPLVWLLMAVVLVGSAFASYRITWYFWSKQAPRSVAAPRAEPSPEVKVVTPTVGGALAGLELNIPEAEYPVEAERAGISGPVTVQIKVNKKGRVVSAQSSTADRRLSAAAVRAARKATFSPEKLAQLSPHGVVVSGSITYEFAPTPTAATGAATSSPAVTSSPTDSATLDTTPTTSADPQSPIVSGPLVGTAINVPAAEYPSRSKRAGITGAITVTVRVNRAGKVISWRTSTGDSQLRAAALKAAKKATFSREKLPGTGDVVGTITYRFL